jgi:hypothetical protein
VQLFFIKPTAADFLLLPLECGKFILAVFLLNLELLPPPLETGMSEVHQRGKDIRKERKLLME